MSLFRRVDLLNDPLYGSPLLFTEASILAPKLLAFPSFFEDLEDSTFALDLLNTSHRQLDFFDPTADLIQIERRKPLSSHYRRIHSRIGAESYLETLSDRVSALELTFHRLANERRHGGRKYSWTEEIEGKHGDKKYKWSTEIEESEKKHKKHHHHKHIKEGKSSYKWTAEIKEKGEEGPITRTYTWKSSSGGDGSKSVKEKKEKKKEKKKGGECAKRHVEIEEHDDDGALVLRQAFAKRAGAVKKAKGKTKELSPHDAAATIQLSFRAHLIRRSQALRALRELAVAKSKLKEIRTLFNNFSYRRRITFDTEERQRFTEKIIVVLLTVDAIENVDILVRASKKSMVDEMEAILDVVDPQPPGKSLHHLRRTFDVPDGIINKELAQGVGQIMTMLEQEENNSSTTSSSEA